jgi:hypothetical protein
MPWLGYSIEAEKTIFQRFSEFLLEGGFSDRILYSKTPKFLLIFSVILMCLLFSIVVSVKNNVLINVKRNSDVMHVFL